MLVASRAEPWDPWAGEHVLVLRAVSERRGKEKVSRRVPGLDPILPFLPSDLIVDAPLQAGFRARLGKVEPHCGIPLWNAAKWTPAPLLSGILK